jgi:HAMP domain-containing protein
LFLRFSTLKLRLAWSHGLLLFAVLICWGTVRNQLLSWRSLRTLERHLESEAQFALSHLRVSVGGFGWHRDGLTTAERITLESLRQECVITDDSGNVVSPQDHARLAMALVETGRLLAILRSRGGFTKASFDDGQSFLFVTVSVPGGGPGGPRFLHLGSTLESVDAQLQEYKAFYLRSLPLFLVVSGGLVWFIAGRALRPFEHLAQSIESVSLSNLQSQITTGRSERETQRLVDAFNTMVCRLHQSFDQMRRFNANAAHELRTPLAILQGETELALRSPGLPEGTQSLLASNLEELGRLSRIVNDLLSLADADGGAHVLARVPVPLKPLLEDLADQMGTLAAEQNLLLQTGQIPSELGTGSTFVVALPVLDRQEESLPSPGGG